MLYTIYQITCLETGEVYYGKTCRTMKERMKDHKKQSNDCTSKQIIDRGNYKTEELEKCEKEQSLERESYYIKNFDCINRTVPGRSKTEYYFDNKERMNELGKKWYHNNKDEHNKTSREYHHNNKEKCNKTSKKYYHNNKEKAIQYKLDNKEHIKERTKQYRLDNKEKIKNTRKEYNLNNKEHIKYYDWWRRNYHLGILARNYFD